MTYLEAFTPKVIILIRKMWKIFNRTQRKEKKNLFSSFANFRSDDVKNSRVEGKLWLFGTRTMFSTRRKCLKRARNEWEPKQWVPMRQHGEALLHSRNMPITWRNVLRQTSNAAKKMHSSPSTLFLSLVFSNDVISKNQSRIEEKMFSPLTWKTSAKFFSFHNLSESKAAPDMTRDSEYFQEMYFFFFLVIQWKIIFLRFVSMSENILVKVISLKRNGEEFLWFFAWKFEAKCRDKTRRISILSFVLACNDFSSNNSRVSFFQGVFQLWVQSLFIITLRKWTSWRFMCRLMLRD